MISVLRSSPYLSAISRSSFEMMSMRRGRLPRMSLRSAIVTLNEVITSSDVPDGEKYGLLASWDAVLGLDLEREARSEWSPTPEMLAAIAQRDEARAAKDFKTSDRIRDELQAMGLEVMDSPAGTTVRPR